MEHLWAIEDYQADLAESDWPPAGPLGDPGWPKLEAMAVAEPALAVERLQALSRDRPRVISYRVCLTNAYAELGRRADVDREMRALLALPLRPGTHASLLADWLSHALIAGDINFVRQEVSDLLNQANPPRKVALVLDQLASVCLLEERCRQFMTDAGEWSHVALESDPESITVKGTRGSVLVELGNSDEGAQLLELVLRKSSERINVGIGSLYLALVAKKRGDLAAAREYAKKAREVYPEEWLLTRLNSEGL